MRQDWGSRAGFGTNLVLAGALLFQSGTAVTVTADPDFAGATTTRAQLRTVEPARLRSVTRAQLKEAD